MSKLDRLPRNMLIVICDSRKALLLTNSGSAIRPALEVVDHIESNVEEPAMADRPGRRYDGGAGSGGFHPKSAMELPDLGRQQAEAFAGQLIDRLLKKQQSDPANEILLAAPPEFLGILRDQMPPGLAKLVTVEVPKRLTEAHVDDIARSLVGSW